MTVKSRVYSNTSVVAAVDNLNPAVQRAVGPDIPRGLKRKSKFTGDLAVRGHSLDVHGDTAYSSSLKY
jgi:hypothetical protein